MKTVLYLAVIAFVACTSSAFAVVEPINVPDGGLTVGMLSMAVGGLFVIRRKF